MLVLLAAGLARAADPLATAAVAYREVDEVYTAEGKVEAVRQATAIPERAQPRLTQIKALPAQVVTLMY